MFNNLQHLVSAKPFRVSAVAILAFGILSILILLYFGRSLHQGLGTPPPVVYQNVTFRFLFQIVIPVAIFVAPWFTTEGWKARTNEKVYRWVGLLTTALAIFAVVFMIGVSTHIIVFADYEEFVEGVPVNVGSCDISLPARMSWMSTFASWFLVALMATSVFRSDAQR